jgi:hypothetical protein
MVPCIHLNGSDPANLLKDLTLAMNAITLAIKRVAEAAPNGRDYYVYDRGAIGGLAGHRVMQEHETRCQKLNQVLEEIKEMRDHVQEVTNFRDERRRKDRETRDVSN